MKKIILIFILSIITLSGNYSAYAKELSNKIDNTQVIKDKNLNSLILNKVRDLDTYEPVPKYLQDRYIKNIPENLITNYQIDMANALKHTLNNKFTYNPNVIIEEIQPVIDKYDLGIEPGSESDIFLYKYYIEKYGIKYAKELKELLQLKENTFTKIYFYQLKISEKI